MAEAEMPGGPAADVEGVGVGERRKFEFGVEAILDGLEARLAATAPGPDGGDLRPQR
ncbi:hypothetical protein ACFV2Q_07385 [Streptomyces sp. NPDC059650]|uniref:hypothetical protein n=1 Tax=Streptomyces sp. NPDC059650 TaxID=3346896 RepID=UPI00368351A0